MSKSRISKTGHKYEPVIIKAKTPRVKWYQFWRWHKVKKINSLRSEEINNLFIEHFGEPKNDLIFKEFKAILDKDIEVIVERRKNEKKHNI
jgi:hypothetical protein